MEKVSIIIATYNRVDSLQISLDSALSQTYQNIELIVVDDGSNDGTYKLFEDKYKQANIIYHKLDKNQGATIARNKGLDIATGHYTIVWDSDDKLYSEAIEELIKIFEEHDNLAVVSAPAKIFLNDKVIKFEPIPEGDLAYQTILCCQMHKYKLLRLVNTKIAGSVRFRGKNLDFMYNTEVSKIGPWYHKIGALGDHYLNSDQYSLTVQRKKSNVKLSIMRADILIDYLEKFGNDMQVCPGRYGAYAYGAAVGLLLAGRKKESIKWSKKAVISRKGYWLYKLFLWFSYLPLSGQILKRLFFVKNKIY